MQELDNRRENCYPDREKPENKKQTASEVRTWKMTTEAVFSA